MAKRKIAQFAEVDSFENVFRHLQHQESISDFEQKGKWNEFFFKNDHPLVLELGCGKGEYTVGLAQNYITKNYIGLDLKGNRIWRGAKTALEAKMKNVAFLRTRIENIEKSFAEKEVNEIWITFPDPQLQKERKRLTSPRFLNYYRNILNKDGVVHLKTDSLKLYEYTLDTIKNNNCKLLDCTNDLYNSDPNGREAVMAIKTFYEAKYLKAGLNICYLRFKFC